MIWNRPELRRRKNIEYSEVITESGEWTAPYSGRYDLELHGGGGAEGTATVAYNEYYFVGFGGGSGQLESNVRIEKGTVFTVTIGQGGWNIVGAGAGGQSNGGATTMTSGDEHSYQVSGGGGGYAITLRPYQGAAAGNLASDHSGGSTVGSYGDGGFGTARYPKSSSGTPTRPGQPGAVIITYKGA